MKKVESLNLDVVVILRLQALGNLEKTSASAVADRILKSGLGLVGT